MAYHVSPSSAPSAHLHVSYTSHPHSKDVNNSIGLYSEAGDEIVNLERRITSLEKRLASFASDTQRRFAIITGFTVSLTLDIIYWFLTRLRSDLSQHGWRLPLC